MPILSAIACWMRRLFVFIEKMWGLFMDKANKEKLNWPRIVFAIIFFIIACVIIYFGRNKIFYHTAIENSYNGYRFLWCLACSLIGFSFLVIQTLYHPKSPIPSYLKYYPFMLILISALGFSACHLFENTRGFVFYYLSFSFCVISSFLVDEFWRIVMSLIKKQGK